MERIQLFPPIFSTNLSMELHTCKNCDNQFSGSFCNVCGQKDAHRYTVSHVLHELVHVFTHADKGIFSFAWHIVRKPGIIALDLVQGRRQRHFKLFQYLIIILGITTFMLSKTNFVERTVGAVNSTTAVQLSPRLQEFQRSSVQFLQKYMNIVQFLMIPISAFFSWLFLRKQKFNYAENIVLHAAAAAMANTITILVSFVFLVAPDLSYNLYMFASFVILFIVNSMAYYQFFKLSIPKSIGYAILSFLCAYIVQVVLIAIITFVIMFIIMKNG